ncbi:hypothetical protein ACWDE9_31600, partial [Streptomyces olivaceoviridis]
MTFIMPIGSAHEVPEGGIVMHETYGSQHIQSLESSRLSYQTDARPTERKAIVRRDTDGSHHTLVQDERLGWPDTFSIGYDHKLYVVADQLNRQAAYNGGTDLRRKPYVLYRLPIGSGP